MKIKMKPFTVKRRAAKRVADMAARRRDLLERLALSVAHHEARGDIKTALHYAEMFVETAGRAHE